MNMKRCSCLRLVCIEAKVMSNSIEIRCGTKWRRSNGKRRRNRRKRRHRDDETSIEKISSIWRSFFFALSPVSAHTKHCFTWLMTFENLPVAPQHTPTHTHSAVINFSIPLKFIRAHTLCCQLYFVANERSSHKKMIQNEIFFIKSAFTSPFFFPCFSSVQNPPTTHASISIFFRLFLSFTLSRAVHLSFAVSRCVWYAMTLSWWEHTHTKAKTREKKS